jgi:hypothetical protein
MLHLMVPPSMLATADEVIANNGLFAASAQVS